MLSYAGCISGAMLREAYFETVRAAGLRDVRVLADVDTLASLRSAPPVEIREFQKRTGVRLDELRGLVRSVTFRAVKPLNDRA